MNRRDNRLNIAARLKKVRTYLKYTQHEMAYYLLISEKSYRLYETYGNDLPGKVNISLSSAGFNIHWLYTGQGKMLVSAIQSSIIDESFPNTVTMPVFTPKYYNSGNCIIHDANLAELLKKNNLHKYEISDEEAEQLAYLAHSRKSSSTSEQWLMILFALRNLN